MTEPDYWLLWKFKNPEI